MKKPFPEETLRYVGDEPRILESTAGAVLLFGNSKVAKIASPELIERESFVISGQAGELPVATPRLVDWGVNWLVMDEIEYDRGRWDDDDLLTAVRQMARLHDEFQDAIVLTSPVLRKPFSRDLGRLFRESAPVAGHLSDALIEVLEDPAILTEALEQLPLTLTHGDPWPHNMLRGTEGIVWIDWTQASAAPAVADLASWLDQTPFAIGRTIDRRAHIDAYLDARTKAVDAQAFAKALDAARVAWFLAFDAPNLSSLAEESSALAETMVHEAERALAAVRG